MFPRYFPKRALLQMKIFQLSFLFMSTVLILTCNKPTPPDPPTGVGLIELNIIPRMGGQLYQKADTFENIQGRKLIWEEAKFYISDFTLIKSDGSEEVLKTSSFDSEVMLFDFAEEEVKKVSHGDGIFELFVVDAVDYQGARISFGVPPRLNFAEPSSFPTGHPFNEMSMFTNAVNGYTFVKLEGKIDDSSGALGQSLNQPLSYQLGGDKAFTTLEYIGGEHEFTVKQNEEIQFTLEIDLNRIFYTNSDTIDMVNQNSSTVLDDLSLELMENLTQNAIYKVPFK